MLDKYKDENEFYSLIGIKYKTFMKMVEILKEGEAKQKQIGGRPNKLSIEQRLLMTLEYWKEYSTYRIIAKKYNISHVSCIRNIFWVENTLIKNSHFHIPGKKILLENKGTTNNLLAIDATEIPIERIKKNLKLLFSGKKRQHSLKSQIIIDLFNNKIISVDFCYGSTHDYKLFLKSNTLINPKLELIADSGYQGLQNVHKNTLLPIKKSKNNPLNPDKKEYNSFLSKVRIVIEHVFARLKRFKILVYRYRNKIRRFGLRFNLISGIYNFELS
ncbi:IS5 family transposase [Spiroplasma endosymbiont of Clivina fossor]|uniref:IS5 family transposase n=3 Tax=Spiroplasma endosymbiont of Clivina fossor TaxID=3066282 RepID=UPI003CC7A399